VRREPYALRVASEYGAVRSGRRAAAATSIRDGNEVNAALHGMLHNRRQQIDAEENIRDRRAQQVAPGRMVNEVSVGVRKGDRQAR